MKITKHQSSTKKTNLFKFLLLTTIVLSNSLLFSQTTNSIDIVKDDVIFTFSISCDNGPCQYGQFVNGDFWVIPNSPNGTVLVSNITPEGEFNGAMVNPDLLRDPNNSNVLLPFNQQQQGILNTYSHYNPSLNIMTSLPYQGSANESIFKISATTNGCGTSGIAAGCVETAAVLTILPEVPPAGNNTFRPPFHGNWKPLFTTDKVKMNRLPSLPQASAGNNSTIGDSFGFTHWLTPQIELYHQGMGEFHRATIPHAAQPSYASDQALIFLEDLTRVFGTETEGDKRMAVYSLIQKGIDNYGVFKMGVPFNSGAGQHIGKKPPIVFFAAMYDDEQILEEVRTIASNETYLNEGFFQEDSQIRMGNSGMPIWGDFRNPNDIHWYFSRLYPRIDTNGTMGDPYGFIDGPAGGIHPNQNQTSDRNYLPIVGGLHVGYAFLQHLMPWFKYAAGDEEILLWSDRIYSGYGVDNFEGGLWTKPDPVAPYDANEGGNCKPYKLYSTGITDCNLYMQTWGPNPDDFLDFIPHNGDPNTDGRMPELHGTIINFNRVPTIVNNYWHELRPCSDPNNSNYPCEGLGEVPNDDTLEIPDIQVPFKNTFEVYANPNKIRFTTSETHNLIVLKIYTMSGVLIDSKIGTGDNIEISRSGNIPFEPGIYIFNLRLDGNMYNGRVGITESSNH